MCSKVQDKYTLEDYVYSLFVATLLEQKLDNMRMNNCIIVIQCLLYSNFKNVLRYYGVTLTHAKMHLREKVGEVYI